MNGNVLPSSAHGGFYGANYELRPGGVEGHPSKVTVYFGTPGGTVDGYPARAEKHPKPISHEVQRRLGEMLAFE